MFWILQKVKFAVGVERLIDFKWYIFPTATYNWHENVISRDFPGLRPVLNGTSNYCPFDISRKDVFCLAFSLKWKYFVLIGHILSETICLFCFCVLFSNMYPKIKFIAKNWSDLGNFYSTMIFLNFCLRKYFLIFFAEFKLLIFHNNIVKISEKLIKHNLLKICPQVTYHTNFCKICIHFYYGEKWKYLIF